MAQPQWNPKFYEQPEKKKRSPWLIGGIIAAVLLCGGAFLLFGGIGALIAIFGPEPAGLAIQITHPPTVVPGQDFEIAVKLSNTGTQALAITEIQFPASLVDGAVFTSSDPPSTGQTNYGDHTGFKYDLSIAAGSSQIVTYKFHSVSGTYYSGDVTVVSGPRRKTAALMLVVTGVPPTPAVAALPTATPGHIPYEAVVKITALINLDGQVKPGWTGSGSIITPDGLIVTNAHVVLDSPPYTVAQLVVSMTIAQDAAPQARYTAKIVQADAALDIAVIRIIGDQDGNPINASTLNLPYVQIGDSDQLKLGDTIVVLGYPGIGGDTITLTRGEVSGFTDDRQYGNRAYIKTDATIAGGNSGGLAVNDQYQMVAVPSRVGYGGGDKYVDCRALADTNGDGVVDDKDTCIPTGGFINAMRPVKLAMSLIDAARRGEVSIQTGSEGQTTQAPTGTLVAQDDFSKDSGHWALANEDAGVIEYQNGELWFTVKKDKTFYWSTYDTGENVANANLTVSARLEKATGSGDFGFLCRIQDDKNFYLLRVTEDRYFSIMLLKDDNWITLHDWEFSSSIPDGQAMKLQASCLGDKLSLGVNNKLLVEVTDDTFSTGSLGLMAGTFDTPGITVAFDNFKVFVPGAKPPAPTKPAPVSTPTPPVSSTRAVQETTPTSPAATPQAGAPAGTLVAQDDFDKDSNQWKLITTDNGSIAYQNQELWYTVNKDNIYFWTSIQTSQKLDDASLTVSARVEKATGDSDFGFMCRIQDSKNYYMLKVTEDQLFSISRMQNDQWTPLKDWTTSNDIPTGQPMTLQASCIGNKLSLSVNNKLLAEVTDDTFSTGDVGLIAGTFDNPGLIVAFDDFKAYKP